MDRLSKFIYVMMALGAILIFCSLSLEPYTNQDEFERRYDLLQPDQVQEYTDLRNEYLTNKYRLEDTGISIILVGLWVKWVVSRKDNGVIVTPPVSKLKKYIALLPLYSVLGDFFSLFHDSFRGVFPWYADTLMIPIMGLPMTYLVMFGWAHLNMLPARGCQSAAPLSCVLSFRTNYCTWLISAISVIYIADLIYYECIWNILPALGWLYFFLCIGAVKTYRNISNVTPDPKINEEIQ